MPTGKVVKHKTKMSLVRYVALSKISINHMKKQDTMPKMIFSFLGFD